MTKEQNYLQHSTQMTVQHTKTSTLRFSHNEYLQPEDNQIKSNT